jgi:undecaprenyl-diphosphatase
MWVVSWPGWTPQSWIIVACIAAILVRSGECLGVPLLLIAAGSQLVVRMIKITIDRARPNLGIEPHGPTDPSFPSGHVTQYTFVLGLLAYLAWRRMAPGFGRRVALTACGMLVMLVGPSRIFLGEHWPSDVLGGYLLGGGIVLITIAMLEWRRFGVRS